MKMRSTARPATSCVSTRPWPRSRPPSSRWSKKTACPKSPRKLYDDLKGNFACFYDEKGAVGRRYRRQDEAGTPFCITIDGQTKEDQTVTVRERDSMTQIRVNLDAVKTWLREKLEA